MAIEIKVPTLGESVTEATVSKWFKAAGDAVAVDEPLVELETDKVTIEINAPVSGALKSIAVQEGADHPDTISSAVSNFCMTAGDVPVFYTSNAPTVDEPLIVRRRVRPIQFLQTTWPAGENSLTWPADWPPAEEGRYVWALGSRGSTAVRLITMDDQMPDSPLAAAAMQYDMGCEVQAKALFQSVLAKAQKY